MKINKIVNTVLLSATLTSTSVLSNDSIEHGGDVYLGSDDATLSNGSGRDAFAAGYSVEIAGNVVEDAHAVGFDISVMGDVGGNLYAVGSNVRVDSKIGEDLTVSGFSVRLSGDALVRGNARIAGGSVVIDAPIVGSLLATGGTLKLNETVQGDVRLSASDIKFGDDAVINGSLNYSATEEISIPLSVISPDRISYTRITKGENFREIRDTLGDSVPDLWPQSLLSRLTGVLFLIAFLLIISSVFFAFAPNLVERLKLRATEHAWRSLFYGFIGMSTLFGIIPVSLITLVGIPLTPIAILALIAIWTLGYLLGVYTIASRIWRSSDVSPRSPFTNLLILASGLIAMIVVNFIPIFGWLINLGVVFFGVGAMTFAVMEHLVHRHDLADQNVLPETPKG